MSQDAVRNPKYITHRFTSGDGTEITWDERQETVFTLGSDELSLFRDDISRMPDDAILNDVSGNGLPMGVKIPISQERLDVFLEFILTLIKFREQLSVTTTKHADDRLEEDRLNGEGHPDFRGWLSEDDIEHCVHSIHRIDSARLTIDKSKKRFNSPLALEIRGKRTDGAEGTLAIAFVEETQIKIITILRS